MVAPMSLDTIRKVVIIIITLLWTLSLMFTALDRSWNPPGTLHVLMVAVVTFLLGAPTILKDIDAKPKGKPPREGK
jgi:hypothetical protein